MLLGLIIGALLGWIGANLITDKRLYGSSQKSPRDPKVIGVLPENKAVNGVGS